MNFYQTLSELVKADLKMRYSGSVFGFFWSFMKPLLMIFILYFVFSGFSRDPYFIHYLIIGVLLWNSFQTITMRGLRILVDNGELLKKQRINKHLLLLLVVLNECFTLFIYILIYLLIAFFTVGLTLVSFLVVISLFELFVLAYGIAAFFSVSFVYFKDLQYIVEVFLQALFFLTPVFYSTSIIPARFLPIYFLNPITRIISEARSFLLSEAIPSWSGMLITLLFCLLFLFIGLAVFNKLQYEVVEEL